MEQRTGMLSVTVESARDVRERSWHGSLHPYCCVTAGGQSFRSKPAAEAGSNPNWNATFQFHLTDFDTRATVEIKDGSEDGGDAPLGAAAISLAQVRASGYDRFSAPIFDQENGAQCGTVVISLAWAPYNVPPAQGYTASQGIPSAPYYPLPQPAQPAFANAFSPAQATCMPVQGALGPVAAYGVPAPGGYYPSTQPAYPPVSQGQQPNGNAQDGQDLPKSSRDIRRAERETRRRERLHNSDSLVHAVLNPVRAVVWRGKDAIRSVKEGVVDTVRGPFDGLTSAIMGDDGGRQRS